MQSLAVGGLLVDRHTHRVLILSSTTGMTDTLFTAALLYYSTCTVRTFAAGTVFGARSHVLSGVDITSFLVLCLRCGHTVAVDSWSPLKGS